MILDTSPAYVGCSAAGSAALTWLGARQTPTVFAAGADKPALLGGTPVHKGGWPKWPQWRESWEPEITKVLRSGRWYRGGYRRHHVDPAVTCLCVVGGFTGADGFVCQHLWPFSLRLVWHQYFSVRWAGGSDLTDDSGGFGKRR